MSHSKSWGEIIPTKTTKELKEMRDGADESIEKDGCYGMQDLIIRHLCEVELHRRGKL